MFYIFFFYIIFSIVLLVVTWLQELLIRTISRIELANELAQSHINNHWSSKSKVSKQSSEETY